MATFQYEGYDQLGKAKRGTVEALDQQTALAGIRSRGVNPTRVEPLIAKPVAPRQNDFRLAPEEPCAPAPSGEATMNTPRPRAPLPRYDETFGASEAPPSAGVYPGASSSLPNFGATTSPPIVRQPLLRASSKEMALFYQNLASLVNAGMGLGAALGSMSQAAPSASLRNACRQMSERVMTGAQMSELMGSFPGLFSPLHVGITAAGERGGFLVASFERLRNYCERDYELQTMIKRETWYPKLVALASVLLQPPALVALFMKGPLAWFLIMLPSFLKLGFLGVAWGAFVLARPFIPQENPVKAVWDRVRLYVPLVGKVVRSLSTAKFCRAYGALYAAGVGPGEAIRLSAVACGNMAIGADALAQIPKIESGTQLTEALRATHHFPPLALQMLQIGEQAGDLDVQLGKAADFLESDAETTIRKSIPVFAILLLVFVAFFIVLPSLISSYQDYANKEMSYGE